jgi:hypothetical protein
MLNYAPDGMAAGSSAFGGPEWSIPWEVGHLPDESLLHSMLAASRAAVIRIDAPMMRSDRRTQAAFQPERVSGFCAAG